MKPKIGTGGIWTHFIGNDRIYTAVLPTGRFIAYRAVQNHSGGVGDTRDTAVQDLLELENERSDGPPD